MFFIYISGGTSDGSVSAVVAPNFAGIEGAQGTDLRSVTGGVKGVSSSNDTESAQGSDLRSAAGGARGNSYSGRHVALGASSSQLGTGSGLVPSNLSSHRYSEETPSPSPGLR